MVLSFKQSAIVSRQKYSNAKNKEPHFKFKIEKSVSNQVKLISIIYRLLLNNEEKKEKISKKDCMIVPRLIISLRILISIITTAQRKCTCFING